MAVQDDVLHEAVLCGDVSKVKSLLASGADVNTQNEDGDQPAHIAARHGRVECMELLIAYGAPLGKRNWAALTPVGEARMNNSISVIHLLDRTHVLPVRGSYERKPSQWETKIEEITEGWEEVYDLSRQATFWIRHRGTSREKVSCTPPRVPSTIINMAREENECMISRRLGKLHAESVLRHEYEFERGFNRKLITKLNKKFYSIVKIHRALQRKKAENCAKKNLNSVRLQCFWRRRAQVTRYAKIRASALKLQGHYRMRNSMNYFTSFQYERLWWFRETQNLARIGQKLWRGFMGRSKGRRQFEIKTLPNPILPNSLEFWMGCQMQSKPPKEQLDNLLEFTLGGTPITWKDRRIKRNGRFRDVKFYVNRLSNKAQWEMPEEWENALKKMVQDREQLKQLGYAHVTFHTVIRLQRAWKAKIVRRKFQAMVKTMKMTDNAKIEYMNRPTDLKAMCHYALCLLAIEHDYDKARLLYCALMQHMHRRGVDHAFILYGYAMFLAVTNEEDVDVIENLITRARVAKGKSSYDIIGAVFFIGALRCSKGVGWHNYALCRILIFNDDDGAKDAFVRGIEASPTDHRIQETFDRYMARDEEPEEHL